MPIGGPDRTPIDSEQTLAIFGCDDNIDSLGNAARLAHPAKFVNLYCQCGIIPMRESIWVKMLNFNLLTLNG